MYFILRRAKQIRKSQNSQWSWKGQQLTGQPRTNQARKMFWKYGCYNTSYNSAVYFTFLTFHVCLFIQLKSRTGVQYLIQYDTESIITDWYKIITYTIRQLVSPKMNIDKTCLCFSLHSLQLCISALLLARVYIRIRITLRKRRKSLRSPQT